MNALSHFPLRILFLLSRSVVVLLRYIGGIPGVSSHAGAKIENETTEYSAQLGKEKKLYEVSTEEVNLKFLVKMQQPPTS